MQNIYKKVESKIKELNLTALAIIALTLILGSLWFSIEIAVENYFLKKELVNKNMELVKKDEFRELEGEELKKYHNEEAILIPIVEHNQSDYYHNDVNDTSSQFDNPIYSSFFPKPEKDK